LLTALAYGPGLTGPFLFDDGPNILHAPYVAIERLDWQGLKEAALTNRSGRLGRPLPTLSFALNYRLAGGRFDPFPFKATNLALHLLCGWAIFGLAGALTRRFQTQMGLPDGPLARWLPLASAALWLLHPLQLTGVLYVVQRMTSMATLCVLLGLLLFVQGRERLQVGRPWGLALMLTGILAGTGLGLLCKETAILLPLLALVIELTAFEGRGLAPVDRRRLRLFWLGLVGLPIVAALGLLALRPEWIVGGYAVRPFTLVERLLTEARVVFLYLGLFFVPRLDAFGLFHDDIPLSLGLLQPWTTAPAMAGWVLVVVSAGLAWRRGQRVWVFATAWFLVGHLLESTLIPLEIAHEHRNYLPLFGPIFGLVWYLGRWAVGYRHPRSAFAAALAPVLLLLALITHERAATWGSEALWVETELRHHPASARVNLSYAGFMEGQLQVAVAYHYYREAARLDGHNVSGLVAMARIASLLAVASQEAPQADRAPPASYRDDLSWDRVYLGALIGLIDGEIQARLRREMAHPMTLAALEYLSARIEQGDPACIPLRDRAMTWMEILLQRPGFTPGRRAALLYNQARVLAQGGDLPAALERIHRARGHHPADVQLLVYEALLQLRSGNLTAADALVDELASLRAQVGFKESDLALLRAEWDRVGRAATR